MESAPSWILISRSFASSSPCQSLPNKGVERGCTSFEFQLIWPRHTRTYPRITPRSAFVVYRMPMTEWLVIGGSEQRFPQETFKAGVLYRLVIQKVATKTSMIPLKATLVSAKSNKHQEQAAPGRNPPAVASQPPE